MQPYPAGIDCTWLASDREGHLAAFITAGFAPIPAEALASADVPIEDVEVRLCELPRVSQARLLVSVKRPDDFIDLAERGVFVYDWTDINRTASQVLRAYEPVAVPTKPIVLGSLPLDLAAVARVLQLSGVVFAAGEAVDIRAHFRCSEAALGGHF